MQEEVNEKTVSLCITGGKVTVRLLKQAMIRFLAAMEKEREKIIVVNRRKLLFSVKNMNLLQRENDLCRWDLRKQRKHFESPV